MDHLPFGFPQALTLLYAREVDASLHATCILLSVWCLISTLEWVGNFGLFRDDELLSWRILSLRPERLYRAAFLQPLFRPRGVAVVISVRLGAALILPFAGSALVQMVLLLALIATSWTIKVRSWLGEDGSDQIGQIVSVGACLIAAGNVFGDLALAFSGTVLITGQLAISYFIAGFAKLLSAEWRRGLAVVGVMGTHSYGHPLGARLVGSNALFAIGFCWFVIVAETIFPVFLLAPPQVLLWALAGFAAFHVATSYFMGLNTFLWAFLSSYPSIILANELINRAISPA